MRHHPRDVKVAIVGCGRIGESHLEVIQSMSDCHLVAAVDVRPDAAERFVQRAGGQAYRDYREAFERERPDAMIVCVPPALHAEAASFCLKRGAHVLCEKPLAVSVAEAEQMVAAAEAGDAVLMMTSKFRFVRDVLQAKTIIESGILGDVILYENAFCSRVDMRGSWYSQPAISGGGVLIDNGSHSVDIARYLVGPIVEVQGQEGKNVQALEVEESVQVYFRTAFRVMGAFHLSWSITKDMDSYINVYGTEGQLSIGWKGSRYRQSEKMHWVTFGEGYRKLDAMKAQMQNFVDVINGVNRPVITEADALDSVRVIETAYRSLSMNKWLAVEEAHALAGR